jgi:hypothetical protein
MTQPVDGVRENLPQYGFDALQCCDGKKLDYDYEHAHEHE